MINYLIFFIILLAILPHLLFFIIYSKSGLKGWLAFVIGGLFWFIALMLRSPILQVVLYMQFSPQPIETIASEKILEVAYSPWYIAFSSVMAGVFEELFRFLGTSRPL